MSSRRQRRMSRNKGKGASLSLTSLMDVFTILVLYLLVNQGSGADIDPPKTIKLPDSIVETSPRQTIVMTVSDSAVFLQGEAVITVAEVLESKQDYIEVIRQEMVRLKDVSTEQGGQVAANNTEVTILADRGVPFKILKKLMSTSSSAGYVKISLAVNQKEKQN
ncbi:MAG: biopolymer transporter ExbD [Gallionellaceae bacterium]